MVLLFFFEAIISEQQQQPKIMCYNAREATQYMCKRSDQHETPIKNKGNKIYRN